MVAADGSSFLNAEWKSPTPVSVSNCQMVNILSETENGLWLIVRRYTIKHCHFSMINIISMGSNSMDISMDTNSMAISRDSDSC